MNSFLRRQFTFTEELPIMLKKWAWYTLVFSWIPLAMLMMGFELWESICSQALISIFAFPVAAFINMKSEMHSRRLAKMRQVSKTNEALKKLMESSEEESAWIKEQAIQAARDEAASLWRHDAIRRAAIKAGCRPRKKVSMRGTAVALK